MARVTTTYVCKSDAYVRSPSSGEANSDQLPVGAYGGHIYRTLLDFPLPDWTGLHVTSIISAKLRVRNSSQVIVNRGADPRILIHRITERWIASTATYSNQPAATVSGQVDSGAIALTDGLWVEIPVTALVRAWAPASVAGGGGARPYGWKLLSADEGSTARTTEFTSRQSPYAPQLVITFETNTAPEAPINLAPAGGDIAPIATPQFGPATIEFTGERVDVDAGDYITAVELAAHADGATDGAPGAAIESAIVTVTGSPPTFRAVLPSAAFTIGTAYRWRARTKDRGGLWSPWSSLADGQFVPDEVPGAPTNLAVDTASLTPHFFGSIAPLYTGQVLGAVRVLVYQDSTLGAILKWDSGFDDTGGTRFDVTYGGTPLEVGSTYRWAAAIKDAFGAESPLSTYRSWVVADISGPSAMSPIDVETKQNSLTPTLTIGHSAAFDAYELEVARFADGSGSLWDVGVTPVASTSSTDVVYAGTALTWGRTYYWRAKVRVGGTTWTDWSPWFPFYVNAVPLAPIGAVDGSTDSGDHFTVTTSTATLRFPFRDPDVDKGYAEAPLRREIEIVKVSDLSAFGASPYVITTGITDTMVTGTLTAETVYQARARYDDSAGQRSPWSEWIAFKRSSAPTIAEGTAVDPEDPNPLVDWTFTSGPGKPQAFFQVQVFDDATGQLVHDSGLVASAATEYEVPGEILDNATDYRYRVVAYDTDLLSDTLDGDPWTTDFGTPNDLTGLAAAADSADSSVVLTWNVTDLDPDLFWRYYVYRLDDTGVLVRIGEVDDVATPTFTDLEARHGTSTYGVTVTNGWAESGAVTVSVTLALDWWISDPADPSLRFELLNVTVHRARHARQQEAFEPLGREFPVVVSGSVLAPSGQLTIILGADEADVAELLRRAARVSPYVIFKDPFGGLFRIDLGSVDVDRLPGSMQTLSVDYRTVA